MKKSFFKVCSLSVMLGLLPTISYAQNAPKEPELIYKFKGSNGSFIYTDRLPASERGQFTVLSAGSGMIKKVVEKEMSAEEAALKVQQLEQQKAEVKESTINQSRDNALLIAYSNVSDIDRMRDYELNQIDLGIKNNIDNIAVLRDRKTLLEQNAKINPDEQSIKAELNKTNNDIQVIQKTLDNNKNMYAERSKKYEEDKKRFEEILKEKAGSTPSAPTPNATPQVPPPSVNQVPLQ